MTNTTVPDTAAAEQLVSTVPDTAAAEQLVSTDPGERIAATLTTLVALARTHDLRLPTEIRDNSGDGQILVLRTPLGRRDLLHAWAQLLGAELERETRTNDDRGHIVTAYGSGWLGWSSIQIGTYRCPAPDEPVPFDPGTGPVPGYVAGHCGHRVAESEWRAGFRTCERCPEGGA